MERRLFVTAVAVGLLSLAVSAATAGKDDDTYIRAVAFEMPGHESVLLRWPERKMPLRVYLTEPPDGLFENPKAIHQAVREGIVDWTDVVKQGLLSFVFVDEIGKADIPVVWAKVPDGDWYIAHCAMDINVLQRRFGVSRVLVTGRWGQRVGTQDEVYRMVLHEMGHALGLGGHSDDPADIMFASIDGQVAPGLSLRDRATLTQLYSRPNGSRVTGARRNAR